MKKRTLLLLLITLVVIGLQAQTKHYVKYNANGSNNGTSWADAYTSLESALEHAVSGDKIWVAAGSYKPSREANSSSNDSRDRAFVLKSGVKIYGGFAGTETGNEVAILAARDFTTNTSILSGDIGTEGDYSDNCYHVVVGAGIDGNSGTVLDGFTISGGNANGSGAITINAQAVDRYRGGGIVNQGSSPTLTNLRIIENMASDGGGICNTVNSFPLLTNLLISGNTAIAYGGGIYNYNNSNATLTNLTISGNTAGYNGGGIFSSYHHLVLRNSIVWGNNSGIFLNSSSSDLSYSLVQGLGTSNGTGMLDGSSDPLFVDAANGDYRLQAGSPAINAGSNAFVPVEINTDLDGKMRIIDNIVDLGAYEAGNGVWTLRTSLYVNHLTNGSGYSFSDGFASFDSALAAAQRLGTDTIFVARGSYTPSLAANGTSTAVRDRAFVIPTGMKIYGGFSGNETTVDAGVLAARDFATNATILNGALNATDSVYHVVLAVTSNQFDTIRFDGFTVTGGKADGTGFITLSNQAIPQNNGGGLYARAETGHIIVCNNNFTRNRATNDGGGLAIFAYSGSGVISNNSFSYNKGIYGGGANTNASHSGSSIVVSNNSFTNNTGQSSAGIRMYTTDGTSVLDNNYFTANVSTGEGGAIYAEAAENSSTVRVTNNTITNNSALNGGVFLLKPMR